MAHDENDIGSLKMMHLLDTAQTQMQQLYYKQHI